MIADGRRRGDLAHFARPVCVQPRVFTCTGRREREREREAYLFLYPISPFASSVRRVIVCTRIVV